MKDEQGMPLNTVTAKVALAYACPPPPRPTRIQFAEAAPAGGAARIGLAIQAIEVCQVIQSVENSVTLIADKATLVRVYVDQASVIAPARVRGEIAVRTSAQGPATYVPSLNELSLDPAELAQLVDKRQTIAKSLNFRLPDGATRPGELFVEVNRVTPTGGEDQPLTGMRQTSAKFISAPPLRIRCIGLRYRDTKTSKTYAPDAVHFTYLRSFLARAYPVPSVIWSQIVVDADFSAPFSADTVVQANMQLAAIRSADVNSGVDPRTHYFGLVDDANRDNFLRGRAMGVPTTPQPDTVATAPCGVPNGFGGANGPSYADWYGAHELGHTFGRPHPGYPEGAQDKADADFPFANGQLSNADRKFVGYDLGDGVLGLPLQVLPGTDHHDVMTYAERQWICNHTFEAIRIRLEEEDRKFAPATS